MIKMSRKRQLTTDEADELLVLTDEISELSRRRAARGAIRRHRMLEVHESGVTLPDVADAVGTHVSLVSKELKKARAERDGERASKVKKRLGLTK